MPVPDNLKTPGTYFDVNTNTQRTGLPANLHRVLFVTEDSLINDTPIGTADMPQNIYDQAQADRLYGDNSIAGRMITAAIKTNRTVDVQSLGKGQAELSPPA